MMVYKSLYGWGKSNIFNCNLIEPNNIEELQNYNNQIKVARGMGRSYGDSAIQKNLTISTKKLDKIIYFNKDNGIIKIQAGITIDKILKEIIPNGWFMPVTPGSKYVSIGGAVSSDVHGKNHHIDGSIYNYINNICIINFEGTKILCSKTKNKYLFDLIVGGMGLFGIIIEVELRLKKIENKYIYLEKSFYNNYNSIIESFDKFQSCEYTVAWVDFMTNSSNNIRGILFKGRHAINNELPNNLLYNKLGYTYKRNISIFFNFPNFFLNKFTVKIFNIIYFNINKLNKISFVNYDNFFYPLDKIRNWNKIYGKKGFLQYQFLLPQKDSKKGIQEIFDFLILEKCLSFLTVIKKFGKKNNSILSFPQEGITVTLDFKNNKKNNLILNKLDEIVLKYNGNIYLAKDSRIKDTTFYKLNRKKIDYIKKYRDNLKKYFKSAQSERINL